MYTPRTKDEYMDLLDEVIYEIDEILLCAEDEGEPDYQLSGMLPMYEFLARALRELHARLRAGEHAFADGKDLPFMPSLVNWRENIPLRSMIEALNRAHRSGF